MACVFDKEVEHHKPYGDVEKREPHNYKPHYRARAKCHAQALVEGVVSSPRRAVGGVGRGFHSEESGQAREKSAGDECEGHPVVLHFQAVRQKGEKQGYDDEYNRHHLVLLA